MRRLTTITALTAGLVALGTTAALASGPPYTVRVGSATTGTYSVNFARVSGTPLTFSAGLPVNCTNLTASSLTTAGMNMNPIFVFNPISLTGCDLNGAAVSATLSTTPSFIGTGSNATAGNETIAGRVANLSVRFSNRICEFNATGYASASFNESTQRLLINEIPTSATVGNLTASNVVGCGGRIQNGNKVSFVATLAATSAGGAVNLS